MKLDVPLIIQIISFWGGAQVERSSDVVRQHNNRAVARTHFLWGKKPTSKFAPHKQEEIFQSRRKSKKNVSGLSWQGVVLWCAEKGGLTDGSEEITY